MSLKNLENEVEELESKIEKGTEERRREAKNKNILERTISIIEEISYLENRNLGISGVCDSDSYYLDDERDLKVGAFGYRNGYDEGSASIFIPGPEADEDLDESDFSGRQVFSANEGEIWRYIPQEAANMDWEDSLDSLYEEVHREYLNQRKERLKRKAENWALDL